MTPSGATHMERATLPTRVALVPNVFATQSVVYCAWHSGAIVAISSAARNVAWIRFMIVKGRPFEAPELGDCGFAHARGVDSVVGSTWRATDGSCGGLRCRA